MSIDIWPFKRALSHGDKLNLGGRPHKYLRHRVTAKYRLTHTVDEIHVELVAKGFDLNRHIETTEEPEHGTVTYHQFQPSEPSEGVCL